MSEHQTVIEAPPVTRVDKPYRRRHYFIDPGLQLRYLVHLSTVALVFGAGAMLAGAVYADAIAGLPVIRDLIGQGLVPGMLATAAAALVLFVGASSLFLSHRLAGPGYRLRKALEQVERGERGFRVHLRRHDELKDTAAAFNAMLDSLERRAKDEDRGREAIRRDVRQALELLRETDQPQLPEALRLLEECDARLRALDDE